MFDTTVLIDGLFVAQSPSSKALREVKRGRVQLVLSPSILGEFQGVLQGARFRQSELRVWMILEGLKSMPNVTIVQPKDVPGTVPGDAMDDHVVATAMAGKADLVVSTDHHLLAIKQHGAIRVVTPDEFLVIIGVAKAAKPAPQPPRPDVDGLAA